MSREKRDKEKARFDKGESRVMLLSSAGLEGLSFNGVNMLFMYEPPFNKATEEQATGRANRYKSHVHLPKDRQYLKIFHLIVRKARTPMGALLYPPETDAGELTSDEILREMARDKHETNKTFLKKLKQIKG